MLRTEKVRVSDWHRQIRQVTKQLDQTNIKILSTMWKFGPRNLLQISRRTGIPFTSVYHRVGKLEAKTGSIARVTPKTSRLGLIRILVFVTARPGMEDRVTAALKVPNFWQTVTVCEGPFTHYSVYAFPVKYVKDFRKYLTRLSDRLVTHQRIITSGDFVPNFPNFSYYNSTKKVWSFEWDRWLSKLKRFRPSESATIRDPGDYSVTADKRDLLVVRELENDARTSFAAMSPILGISLQGVKYHYDKRLVPAGIVERFELHTTLYPNEVSAYLEVMLEFSNTLAMNKFYSIIEELFFVLGVTKVLRRNSLAVRVCVPQSQLHNLFEFFSCMAKTRMLEAYSTVRLNFSDEETHQIPYDQFEDEKGWSFDLVNCISKLSKLH